MPGAQTHMNPIAKNRLCCGLAVFDAAVFAAALSFVLVTAIRSPRLGGGAVCGAVLQRDDYILARNLDSDWRRTYENHDDTNNSITVTQRCPHRGHSADVFFCGAYAGGTRAETVDIVSQTAILDCHGRTLFALRTGDFFRTTINGREIRVSYEITDKDEVVAYSTAPRFVSDAIALVDGAFAFEGNPIANLTRDGSAWTIEIFDDTHPIADPVVLLAVLGARTFHEDGDDRCNALYRASFWISIVAGTLLAVALAYLVYLACGFLRRRFGTDSKEPKLADTYIPMISNTD